MWVEWSVYPVVNRLLPFLPCNGLCTSHFEKFHHQHSLLLNLSTSDAKVEGSILTTAIFSLSHLLPHLILSSSLHSQFSALHSKSPCRTSLDHRIEGRVTRKAVSRNYASTCSIIRTTSTPSTDEHYSTHHHISILITYTLGSGSGRQQSLTHRPLTPSIGRL